MAVIRSYVNGFQVTDYTEELNIVPNTFGLVNELNIFRNEAVSQHTITIEQIDKVLGLITDKVRGERANVSKDGQRLMRAYAIPHFPADDAIFPSDVQGKRAYGSEGVETVELVKERKLETLRKSHAITVEFARMQAITQGTIYAPNGTVVGNYYNDFGVQRKEIAFDLGNSATNVGNKITEVVDHIQLNIASGETPERIICLASPEFFDDLINQAGVKSAYQFYSSTQEPLRNSLRKGLYDIFEYKGVTFYRYIGGYKDANGDFQKFIPTGDAYFLPLGTQDTFVSYYSPANKFDLVNTLGEEAYVFMYEGTKGDKIEIESEHNAIHLVRRPQVIVRATTGATTD